jgi:hypothetical protein
MPRPQAGIGRNFPSGNPAGRVVMRMKPDRFLNAAKSVQLQAAGSDLLRFTFQYLSSLGVPRTEDPNEVDRPWDQLSSSILPLRAARNFVQDI